MNKAKMENCFSNICKYCSHLKYKNNKNCIEELNDNISMEEMNEVVENIRLLPSPAIHIYSEKDIHIRSQMIGYLDRICSNVGIPDDTFFIAVDIFDEITRRFNFSLSNEDLILIGLTTVFVACKINEGKTIEVNFLVETLGQGKFDRDDFLMTEVLILKTLGFRIPRNYFVDFVNCTLKLILPSLDCVASREMYIKIKENYKKSLYINNDRADVIRYYISIVYNTISLMDILTVKMNSVLIFANLSKLAKLYRINFQIASIYNNNLYITNHEIISDCKV
jgi:hypothetical protein